MKEKILPDPSARVSNSNNQAAGGEANRRLAGYRNILVPVDFSEHSKKTIEYARQLAASTGAVIKIMHVLRMPKNPERLYEGLYIADEVTKTKVEEVKREANDQLSVIAERLLARGSEAQPLVRTGIPYQEIVSAAEEVGADLIVIGSHGYGGLGRLFLGSTAERVLRYAPCAVLIVKDPREDHFFTPQPDAIQRPEEAVKLP